RPLVLNRLNPTWATLWYRSWHQAALRANLYRSLRERPVQQIIAQCPPSARVAMDVLQRLGLRDRVPVAMVCHFNGSEAGEYRDQGVLTGAAFDRLNAEEEQTLRDVDRVIYVSAWARELVETGRGISTRQSSVVWNGIDDRTSTQSPITRQSLGLRAEQLVVINVGTLEPRKNQLGLLPLFARVVADRPDAVLLLVGEGPHRPLIEAEAQRLGIAANVKLLGHRRDVPDLLALSDLYLHFASAENCPISLIEASRAGLPWGAKPLAGVQELVPALGGIALSPDSIDDAFTAIRPLLHDDARRRVSGAQSRAKFLSAFTQGAMVDAYLAQLGLTSSGGAG
ncbi:MAG: glycosyltransferase family 4 protein, partial [Tepidisphaeraceae bacterium]